MNLGEWLILVGFIGFLILLFYLGRAAGYQEDTDLYRESEDSSDWEDRAMATESDEVVPDSVQRLLEFAGEHEDLLSEGLARLRNALGTRGRLTVADAVISDLVAIIRSIALPQDEIRGSDRKLVLALCAEIYRDRPWSPEVANRLIDNLSPDYTQLLTIRALVLVHGPEVRELAGVFLDIGRLAATFGDVGGQAARRTNLKTVEAYLHSIQDPPPAELPEDLRRRIEQLQRDHLELQERIEKEIAKREAAIPVLDAGAAE